MLDKTTLDALKQKMPTGYEPKVQKKYEELTQKTTTIRTVRRFFAGTTYTEEMNKAILAVIKEREDLLQETIQTANG